MKTILLDVGGTFVKCADGRQVPISSEGSRDAIRSALTKAIGPTEGVGRIGVAIPGPFDYRQGIFLMKHKFGAVYGESFRTLTGVPDDVPMRFHHDVNALLKGAVRMLGLEGENVALVTLGTGLGFSYALQGQVQYNELGSPARSLWNLPLEGGGILEDIVSARGLRIAYANLTGDALQSARSLAQLAYAGDPVAQEVYARMGSALGRALQAPVQELNIGTLLMGGQISHSLPLLLKPLQDTLEGVEIRQAPEGAVFEGLASLFDNQ